MSEVLLREIVDNVQCAFVVYKPVYNENNNIVDFLYIDVNKSFEDITELKKEDIVNKRFLEDISKNKKYAKIWIDRYKEVLLEGKMLKFEEFSEEFKKYFMTKVFSTKKDTVVVVFSNITFQKKLQQISKYFLENIGNTIDYKKTTEFARNLTGADYAVFNLFKENNKNFSTVAISAKDENINKAYDILGYKLIGKEWDYRPFVNGNDKDINEYKNIYNINEGVIPKIVIEKLENHLNIENIIIARVRIEEKIFGDFTLIYKKKNFLINKDLFKIFMSQLGLFIENTIVEESLKVSQRRLFMIAKYAPIGFLSCNTKGEIIYSNERILDILGLPSCEDINKINLYKFHNLKKEGFSEKLKECIKKEKTITFETAYINNSEQSSWLRIHLKPNKDYGEIIGANIVIDDISEKKRKEEILKNKVKRDPLTNAYNRNAFDDVLIKKLNLSKDKNLTSCIALVDIDDFKKINDNYGHRTGDKILKYFTNRVKQELRDEDLFIRTGGDEFLIYLHDIKDENNASNFIERIFNKSSSEYRIADEIMDKSFHLKVTFSMGASFYPRDGETIEKLMSQSDKLLYDIKKKGKSSYKIKTK